MKKRNEVEIEGIVTYVNEISIVPALSDRTRPSRFTLFIYEPTAKELIRCDYISTSPEKTEIAHTIRIGDRIKVKGIDIMGKFISVNSFELFLEN